jgi:hypothetical protein
LNGIWELFEDLGFFGVGQRRGARVNIPEIGSRDGVLCFGGILGNHAVLRRDSVWGNFNLEFFEVLGVGPRGSIEEGGRFVFPPCVWGNSNINLGGFCRVLTPCKVSCGL